MYIYSLGNSGILASSRKASKKSARHRVIPRRISIIGRNDKRRVLRRARVNAAVLSRPRASRIRLTARRRHSAPAVRRRRRKTGSPTRASRRHNGSHTGQRSFRFKVWKDQFAFFRPRGFRQRERLPAKRNETRPFHFHSFRRDPPKFFCKINIFQPRAARFAGPRKSISLKHHRPVQSRGRVLGRRSQQFASFPLLMDRRRMPVLLGFHRARQIRADVSRTLASRRDSETAICSKRFFLLGGRFYFAPRSDFAANFKQPRGSDVVHFAVSETRKELCVTSSRDQFHRTVRIVAENLVFKPLREVFRPRVRRVNVFQPVHRATLSVLQPHVRPTSKDFSLLSVARAIYL